MTTRDDQSISAQDQKAMRHYDDMTVDLYMARWNSEHFHCGLFEDEDIPKEGAPFAGPESLTRGLERMIEAIVTPAKIKAHHHVVDAGCGIGGTSLYLAKTRGCRVTGVNLHEGQLEMAEKRANDAGLARRVGFKHGDCSRRLPFDSNSIDIVVNIESACHYSDREQFLREVHRILKPDGRIVALDWLMTNDATAEQRERYIKPLCDHWALSSLESLSSYARLLRETGFAVLECVGFDGKDIGNLRLIENYARWLRGLNFCGLLPTKYRPVMQRFDVLEKTWQNGCFECGRYCAAKPGSE